LPIKSNLFIFIFYLKLKKISFIAILFILFCAKIIAQEETSIFVEGVFQGKNIFIKNPFSASGIGFCVNDVVVNGNVTTDEVGSSAFEIDLKVHQLKIGQKVEIKINHKSDCKPKVLNIEAIRPKSTFEVISMEVNEDGVLKWTTKNEQGRIPYNVEQLRWNKWLKVGELEGAGDPDVNNYEFKVSPNSGKNTFRLSQTDYTGSVRLSKSVEFISQSCNVAFSPAKVSKDIYFSCSGLETETQYEIYDKYGNIIKMGFGNKIDCRNLKKGAYFLNYDNKMSEFIKK
jgi:hypothetical protein